jgi:hypothetical protein
MILWTIQTTKQYENLLGNRIIYGDARFVEKEFFAGYSWMITQMQQRIGKRPFTDCYPIWGWYQWNGIKQHKPDLRYSGHLPKGAKAVCVRIEKQAKDVLLSDFDLWRFPLSYDGYIGSSEKDSLAFDEKLKAEDLYDLKYNDLPKDIQQIIQKSWDKIFDTQFEEPYYTYKKEEKSIQASFWSLSIDEIIKVEEFTAI